MNNPPVGSTVKLTGEILAHDGHGYAQVRLPGKDNVIVVGLDECETTTDLRRYALVTLSSERDNPVRYLPGNYHVLSVRPHPERPDSWRQALVGGEDYCGWTLDDYVLPRLASGMMPGHEIDGSEATQLLERTD